MKLSRAFRIVARVGLDDFFDEHVHIPNDQRARRKIVGAFLRHRALGSASVVPFASYFYGEDWRAFKELGARARSNIKRGIGAEGSAIRQVDDEADVIAVCAPNL